MCKNATGNEPSNCQRQTHERLHTYKVDFFLVRFDLKICKSPAWKMFNVEQKF